MNPPSVYVFPFEGHHLCFFNGGLRHVEELNSSDGEGLKHQVTIDGVAHRIATSDIPLLKQTAEAGEIERLLSFLFCQLRALEQTVESLDAGPGVSLSVGNDSTDPVALMKELQTKKAENLRLAALVDYQKREIDTLRGKLAHYEAGGPLKASSGKEEAESDKKPIVLLGKRSPRPGARPHDVKDELLEYSMDSDEEMPKGSHTSVFVLKKPADVREESSAPSGASAMGMGSAASIATSLTATTVATPSSLNPGLPESNASTSPRPVSARLPEPERPRGPLTKEEKEAMKKAEKERKKAEEEKRKVEEREARRAHEEEKRRLKEQAKREKEAAKHMAASGSQQEAPKAEPPPKDLNETKIKSLLKELLGISNWKPGSNADMDAQALALALLEDGNFELQRWVFEKASMKLTSRITLSLFAKFDKQVLDTKQRWAPLRYYLLRHCVSSSIMYRHKEGIDTDEAGVETYQDPAFGHPEIVPTAIISDRDITRRLYPIQLAARYGQLDFFKYCLEKGASIHDCDDNQASCAHYAARGGQLHILEFMMPKGAALGARDGNGRTVAHWAVLGGHLPVLKWLQGESMDLNATDSDRMTPISHAASLGHMEIVRFLVDEAEVDPKTISLWPRDTTLSHLVALHGDLEMIKWLDQHKVSLDKDDDRDFRVSHYACITNQLDILKWLHANRKSDFTNRTSYEQSMMHLACSTGNMEMLEWLATTLTFNASVLTSNKQTLAHYAAKFGQLAVLQWLHKRKVPMFERSSTGMTILMYAARAGNVEAVKWIASQCVPTSRYYEGTPTQGPPSETAPKQKPLSYKDKRAETGQSVVHYAAASGNVELMEFLLSDDVEIGRFDDLGGNAAHYAARAQSVPILQWLHEHQLFDPNLKDSRGYTPGMLLRSQAARNWFSAPK